MDEARADEAAAATGDAVRRFEASMVMDFDKWHDGIGYDLTILSTATPDERAQISAMLLARGVDDWRDVEAIAALDSLAATDKLTSTLTDGSLTVRLAVLRNVPDVASEQQRIDLLVEAVGRASIGDGLTPTLLEIETFHPPVIVDALLRGTLTREGEVAVHLAAMVAFVSGATDEAFDWAQRPLFLRFHTDDRDERIAALTDLCTLAGIDPEPYLRPAGR